MEIAKFKWQYKTVTAECLEEFESSLNTVGEEEWECFAVIPTMQGYCALCRKFEVLP